jgi:hypothetical protein
MVAAPGVFSLRHHRNCAADCRAPSLHRSAQGAALRSHLLLWRRTAAYRRPRWRQGWNYRPRWRRGSASPDSNHSCGARRVIRTQGCRRSRSQTSIHRRRCGQPACLQGESRSASDGRLAFFSHCAQSSGQRDCSRADECGSRSVPERTHFRCRRASGAQRLFG